MRPTTAPAKPKSSICANGKAEPSCRADYTRKFELARWYVDARNSYAVNPEIPEGPPDPIDDGFGLGGGGMPAQDSAAQVRF